jgi:ribosomal protein L10
LAISKQRKVELVAQYVEQLQQSQGIILADYLGLSVGDMGRVRHAMRPIGGKFQVVKNRLMALA